MNLPFYRILKLKFIPLEFETVLSDTNTYTIIELKFIPLEFETSYDWREEGTHTWVKIYSVGI